MKIKLDKKQLREIKQAANMYYINSNISRDRMDSDEFLAYCWTKALEQIIKKNNPELDVELP